MPMRTEIAKLRGSHVQLIVLPEDIARVAPEWVTEAQDKLAAAAPEGATVVAGFNTFVDGAQRNVSWALSSAGHAAVTYEKRRLVPGLETAVFTPGPGPRTLSNGIGLEICKDMDFHAMIRSDEVATKPTLLAVPAWDFRADDWSHARVAILRSVENGVPMARTARNGLLSLNDRYGRIVAQARSVGGFTTLIGDLPLDGLAERPSTTVPTTPSAGSVWWQRSDCWRPHLRSGQRSSRRARRVPPSQRDLTGDFVDCAQLTMLLPLGELRPTSRDRTRPCAISQPCLPAVVPYRPNGLVF